MRTRGLLEMRTNQSGAAGDMLPTAQAWAGGGERRRWMRAMECCKNPGIARKGVADCSEMCNRQVAVTAVTELTCAARL